MISRCVNSLTTQKEQNQVQIATQLLSLPWEYCNLRATVSLFLDQFLQFFDAISAERILPDLHVSSSSDESYQSSSHSKQDDDTYWNHRPGYTTGAGRLYLNEQGEVAFVDDVMNHWFRPPALYHLPLYDFMACVQLRKLKDPDHRRRIQDSRGTTNSFLFVAARCWSEQESHAPWKTHRLARSHYLQVIGNPGQYYCFDIKPPPICKMFLPSFKEGSQLAAQMFMIMFWPYHSDPHTGKPTLLPGQPLYALEPGCPDHLPLFRPDLDTG